LFLTSHFHTKHFYLLEIILQLALHILKTSEFFWYKVVIYSRCDFFLPHTMVILVAINNVIKLMHNEELHRITAGWSGNYNNNNNEWHYSLDGSKPLLIWFHSLS
jgi:hypothetical protein